MAYCTIDKYRCVKSLHGLTDSRGSNITTYLQNFPVCVHIVGDGAAKNLNVQDAAFFFGEHNRSGKRVGFYDQWNRPCAYEVEYYSNTQGSREAVYWVKAPLIIPATEHRSVLRVAYGNDPNGSDQDNKTAVWDSNYKMVQHLGGNSWGTSPEAKDSTSNGNNGTNTESASVSGIVGNGRSFDGVNDTINVGNAVSLQNSVCTISFGVQTSSPGSGYHAGVGKQNAYYVGFNSNNFAIYDWSVGSHDSGTNLANGTWHWVTGIYNGSSSVMRWDISSSSTFTTGISNQNSDMAIGSMTGSQFLNANIDDVRISSNARSADWNKLEYYSMLKTNWNGDSWLIHGVTINQIQQKYWFYGLSGVLPQHPGLFTFNG